MAFGFQDKQSRLFSEKREFLGQDKGGGALDKQELGGRPLTDDALLSLAGGIQRPDPGQQWSPVVCPSCGGLFKSAQELNFHDCPAPASIRDGLVILPPGGGPS